MLYDIVQQSKHDQIPTTGLCIDYFNSIILWCAGLTRGFLVLRLVRNVFILRGFQPMG